MLDKSIQKEAISFTQEIIRVNSPSWHEEGVAVLVEQKMRALGYDSVRIDSCPNQILRYKDKPIWGIQGHAELNRGQVSITYQIFRKIFKKNGVSIQELEKLEGNNLVGKK